MMNPNLVENQNIELIGSTIIGWMYPEIYQPNKRDSITIELYHTRSANNLHIEFDAERDGYVIQQQTRFTWSLNDPICDPEWKEVAFIKAWEAESSENMTERQTSHHVNSYYRNVPTLPKITKIA